MIFGFIFRNKLELPFSKDAFASGSAESQEIIEEYNEEDEAKWREQHRIKVKEQKLREKNQRLSGEETKTDDVLVMLEEMEIMEELNDELNALNIEDDETLEKIMNGEINLPQTEKNRIAHSAPTKSQTLANNVPPSFTTNNNVLPNHQDIDQESIISDSDSQMSDDDIPEEFRAAAKEASHMSNREKLRFYKKHLNTVQHYLETTTSKTYDEFVIKTDKMFLSDYLLNEIDKIRDALNEEQLVDGTDDSLMALRKETSSELNNNLKETTIKSSRTRTVSFSNVDNVRSFKHNEEPSMISTQPVESNNNRSQILDDDSAEKKRIKEYILKMANLNFNEIVSTTEIEPPALPSTERRNSGSITNPKSILTNCEAVKNEIHLDTNTNQQSIEEENEENTPQDIRPHIDEFNAVRLFF